MWGHCSGEGLGTEARGRSDSRTRVPFFLPTAQASAEQAVYASSSSREPQRTRRVTVAGSTPSRLRNAVCRGGWWAGRDWVREGGSLVVVDDGYPLGNRQLDRALGRLQQVIGAAYSRHASPQHEVWLRAQEAIRDVSKSVALGP